MDTQYFSSILLPLLLEHERVTLHGLGAFVVEATPAILSGDGSTIYPPSYRVSFKMGEAEDDGVLVSAYQKGLSISKEESERSVVEFIEGLKGELSKRRGVELPNVGKLRSTKEGNIFFISDIDPSYFYENLGLSPISLKLLHNSEDEHKEVVEDVAEVVLDISSDITTSEGSDGDTTKESIEIGEVNIDTPDYTIEDPLTEEELLIMEKRKKIIVVLSVIIALLVLVILFLLFKEQLYPIIEGWMYSEEELELIKGAL